MRRHHTGSGRRPAIPADWDTTFGGVVATQWHTDATILLRKPGGTSVWNETLRRTVTEPFSPFADGVSAKVSPITASEVAAVEEQAWVLGYRFQIHRNQSPSPTQLDEGIELAVQTCSDPMLVGMVMRVTEVVRGTHRFERELIARMNS